MEMKRRERRNKREVKCRRGGGRERRGKVKTRVAKRWNETEREKKEEKRKTGKSQSQILKYHGEVST